MRMELIVELSASHYTEFTSLCLFVILPKLCAVLTIVMQNVGQKSIVRNSQTDENCDTLKLMGDSLAVELPALDRSTLVRIQVSQP